MEIIWSACTEQARTTTSPYDCVIIGSCTRAVLSEGKNKALKKSFTLEFVHFYKISALTKNSVVFSRAHIVLHLGRHFSVCSINFLFPSFRVALLNWKSVCASFAGFIELMLMFRRHIPPFSIASINRAPSTIRDVIDPEIARLRFISLVSLFLSQRSSIFGDGK